jgi:hypothetical protein
MGAGYNEYRYLAIFPLRDRLILDMKVQIAW